MGGHSMRQYKINLRSHAIMGDAGVTQRPHRPHSVYEQVSPINRTHNFQALVKATFSNVGPVARWNNNTGIHNRPYDWEKLSATPGKRSFP